ncbi:MAG: tRNA-dihydrouridine synthase [Clostridia bacterium]
MRSLCAKQGASLVYMEMVSAKGLWYGDRKSRDLLEIAEDEGPVAFQLFGSDPEILSFAAKELRDEKNCILDLNVGCPVPKVVKNGEGSALLKKARCTSRRDLRDGECGRQARHCEDQDGIQRGSNTAVETAKLLESAGVAAVAVHGRTREQYYEGKADWQAIADVKRAVSAPIIGNGDVFSGEDAMRMLDETDCDGVIIARGALGNPWIFRDAASLWRGDGLPDPPDDEERIAMLLRHFDLIAQYKGEHIAVREIRKAHRMVYQGDARRRRHAPPHEYDKRSRRDAHSDTFDDKNCSMTFTAVFFCPHTCALHIENNQIFY